MGDDEVIKQWLNTPSSDLLSHIAKSANSSNHPNLAWYPVTKKMSNVQYQNLDCVHPIKLEKLPSIKSFFGKQGNSHVAPSYTKENSLSNNKAAQITGISRVKNSLSINPSNSNVQKEKRNLDNWVLSQYKQESSALEKTSKRSITAVKNDPTSKKKPKGIASYFKPK